MSNKVMKNMNNVIEIQQAPTYLVKRVIAYKEYNPVGILMGESRYYQIFALADDYDEANKIYSKLNEEEVNKDKLPNDIEIRYEVERNYKNNWYSKFGVNDRKDEW